MDPKFTGYVTPDQMRDFIKNPEDSIKRFNKPLECENQSKMCMFGKKDTQIKHCILQGDLLIVCIL